MILFRQHDRAIFAFGLALLKQAATEALGWSGEELDRLAASGTLVEIEDERKD